MSKIVDSNGYELKGLAAWKKQLITTEDPIHIHKTLGILCMASYIFRFAQMGESDMGFARYPHLTLPTVVLHLMLNVSALEFKIPPKRISSGYRIWPEYRLHSLAFLCRSLATIVLYWYEETYHKGPNNDLNLAVVILGAVAADYGTYLCRDNSSRSIRDLDTPNYVKFLFSAAQFFGTTNILFGLRRYSMHMLSVTVIQCNAFMMTIRRKNLASHNGLVTMYGILLLTSLFVCAWECLRVGEKYLLASITVGQIAVVLRMAPWPQMFKPIISNKYVVWITVGLALRHVRPMLEDTSPDIVRIVFGVTAVAMWSVGWYKSFGPASRETTTTKEA